jgi:Domain of unknown function (DUF4296)
MKGKILLICCLLWAGSCRRDSPPPGVLTKTQMVEWMIDIYLAEARASTWSLPLDSSYKIFLPHQDSLKHRYGIQDSTLRKSYEYYIERPTELEAIYDQVIDSLNLREQRLKESTPR